MSSQYHKTGEESPENEFFAKDHTGVTQLKAIETNSYTKCQVNITRQERKVRKNEIFAKGNTGVTQLKVRQTCQNLNLTCIMSRQIHI